jgi:amino acid adenylation domain-containing protein
LRPPPEALPPNSVQVNVDTMGNSSAQASAAAKYVFPSTFAQQRLWFLEQLQPGSTSYLIPWSLRISGKLNAEALEHSLNEIVRRHEILRTTFSFKDGAPVQVVAGELSVPMPTVDLSSSAKSEEEAQRLAREEARKPLDLEHGPLVRAQLLRLGEEEHILLLTMHHIIFDGWSRRILVRELAAMYDAFCSGKPSPLPEPKLQYADYAVWQRKQFQGANLEKQLSYWRQQLAGAPASLDLPTDRPRPAIQTFNGAKLPLSLSKEFVERLQSFSRERGVTMFMTLLAGFQILLSRYSNQDDVAVGSPIANRNRAEIEEMIGFFANTLVLRTQLSGEATFSDVLAQVKETALGAYAHQDVPFEKLVEELRPERNLSQNPLFQVLFSLQNAPQQAFELAGLKLTSMDSGESAAKFDISVFLSENPDGLRGRFEYNTDLFDAETIQRMIGHYRVLLEAAVASPERKASQLQLLSEGEQTQILVDWNATASEYPRGLCLHQLIEQQAAHTPDAIACVTPGESAAGDRSLSYRELNAKANQLAHALRKRGAEPGQRVGIFVERSLGMMVGLLGIQKTGAAYVPLDPAYPAERIRLTLEDAQVAVLVTQQSLAASLPENQAEIICIDSDWAGIAKEPDANPGVALTPEDLAYVIFTSGSTGRPKGVQIRHRGAVNLLTAMATELKMVADDVFPALASFAFDMCIPELYLALISGGQVVIGKRHLAGNGEELAALLRRVGATVVHATPTTWSLLLEAGFTGKGLKRVIGAEPLPRDLCRRLLDADNSLYNFYGPTETTVWSAFHHFRSPEEPVVVGRPLANQQIYILDKDLQPVPVGVAGEIHIGGDGVAAGYLAQPELTAAKFVPDPFTTKPGATIYKTGDLGRFLTDGRIEFQGRADHQVKIRGYRIELGEIEAALGKHPAVQECVVVAREDVPGDKRLVGYVIPATEQNVNVAELRAWVKDRLPEYMVPVAIVEMRRFPLSPNGKVDRRKLPAPEYTRPELENEYQGARTPAEEIISTIWAEVLKLDQIGVHDNFFELGGHSLLATQVVSRIRQVFQIDLPLRALFEAPTVAGVAEKALTLQGSGQTLQAPQLKALPRDRPLPLSFAQQRLWFLDKLEPNNPLYNVPHVVRLKGILNVGALEKALNQIIARHEALRTSFLMVNGSPVQLIAHSLGVHISIADLSALPERAREADARKLALAEIARPFDLQVDPMVRALLLKLAGNEHILVLNTHHIISDRWSLGVLSKELAAFYEQAAKGKPAELSPLPFQYADYAAWQRQLLSGETLEKQLRYWKENLAGAPASLDLPTDRPRPPQQSFRGAKYTLVLPKLLTEQITALGRKEGATIFMMLLAAFSVLLSRYSGQEDIVIGSPIAGRTRADLENLIGFFVNTLVLRANVSGDPTFRELLAKVRETAMGAYAHQDVPFEKLVEELKPQRDLSRNPLFQVMLILQNMPSSSQPMADLEIGPFPLPGESSKFDLTLIAAEDGEGLRATVEYNTDLFDKSTIERLLGHFQVLLQAAVANPDVRLSVLPLLTERERKQILVDWNATQAEYPRDLCLHDLIERQAERTPNAVAVVFGNQQISYRELNEHANQLAHYLQQRGVGPESLVGVFLERSINMVIALLGVLKAGGAYIPLDPAYPTERIGFILEDAGVDLLLTQQDLLALLPAKGATAIDFDAEQKEISEQNRTAPAAETCQENLAYVLYTSGSTGKPKGVQITHANLVNFLTSMQQEPGLTAGDKLLAVTTLSFDIAGLEIYLPLITGAKVVLASRAEAADGRRLLQLMQRLRPTVMQATPATWRMLIDTGWTGSPALRVLCGGEALQGDLVSQLLPRCAQLWNMYGPTETTIWSSVYRVQSATATAPIGHPIANTAFYILDSHMQPVPAGVAGELYVGGAGVAKGYLRRAELTTAKFVADPFAGRPGAVLYRTGDLARYLPDGNVQYLGRTDFQVKIRGFRIELGEIESVLAEHPAVQQAVVAAREDLPGDKRLVGYIVAKPGQHLNTTEARAHLKQSLPDYMLPSALVEVESLPLTPNGKVDRKALPRPDFQPATSAAAVPPRDALEAKLVKIWQEILKAESIGVTDNFFDLGGHSLMAVRLMDQIRKLTGVEIPLTALFQGATVEHLASIVRGTTSVPQTVVQQIQVGGNRPPFFAAVLAGMNALGYVPLAKHLGPEQPFYTLQSPGPGPHTRERPYGQQEYEQVASEYIRAMRAIQPEGPYYIGGTCEGARIAFEITRILETQGQAVDLLAVIDTWVIENTQNKTLWKIYYYSDRLQRWWRRPWSARTSLARDVLLNRIRRWLGLKSAPRKSEWDNAYWPGDDFVPSQVQSRITVYKIPKQPFYYYGDPLLGWGSRTTTGVETHVIPNGRHLLLLREPYVRNLAAALAQTLERLHSNNGDTPEVEKQAGPAEVAAAR